MKNKLIFVGILLVLFGLFMIVMAVPQARAALSDPFLYIQGGTGTTTAPVAGDLLMSFGGSQYGPTALIAGSNITISTSTYRQITISSTASGGGSGMATSSLAATSPLVLTTTSAAATFSWAGLATTSQPSSSNLLVSNGSAGVYGAATSTLTPSSPLTGSFTQIGSSGSVGIQAASASQAGSLAAVDYQLLHTATSTFSSPLVYTQTTNAVTCPTCQTSAAAWSWDTLTNWATSTNATTTAYTAPAYFASSTLASQFPYATSTALTVSGTSWLTTVFIGADSIAEYVADTAGAMFTGNTETGIAVTYQDADNTTDFVVSNLEDLAGTLDVGSGGTGAATFGQGWIYSTGGTTALAASTSPTVNYVVATSTTVASRFPYASTTATSWTATSTGTFGVNLSGGCFAISGTCITKQPDIRSFTYATSTAWTGTTTIMLEQAYVPETINGVRCKTTAGTLNIQYGTGSASTTMLNASTTNNQNLFTTNNTLAVGDTFYVSFGTPASSPTALNCTLSVTPTL